MSWTQDRKDRLKTMWLEGRTSRDIAETLGAVTRNAVMGMVNRMGLMGSQSHNVHLKPVHGACRPKTVKAKPEETPPVIETPAPEPLMAAPQPVIATVAPAPTAPPAHTKAPIVLPTRLRPVATRTEKPDWKTAIDLVEELTGESYDPRRTGHRTALVAIAAILGGGDPRTVLPHDFPEPVISRTMRGMAEKQIMVGGRTPAAWLDPEYGDLSFFIDVLRIDGILTPPRTQLSA